MGNTSLKKIMIRFVLLEVIFTFALGIVVLFGMNSFIFSKILYPANYPERQLSSFAEKVSQDKLDVADIPDFFQYQYWESGELIANTIPEKQESYVKEAKEEGSAISSAIFSPNYFVFYKGEKQQLVLAYQYLADFRSPFLRKYLPKGEYIYTLFFFLIWVLGFYFLIRRLVTKLQVELDKITRGNREVQKFNLEISLEESSIKEVQEILDSLNQMKSALSQSLQEQWRSQQQQKQLIQSVTHDIRTPITITQGSLELLSETELREDQLYLVENAENGMERLRQYVEQLKQISGLLKVSTANQAITEEVIEDWVELVVNIVERKKVTVSFAEKNPTTLKLPILQLTQVLQNLVTNSLDAVAEKGELVLSFVDKQDCYEIIVQDNGTGFSEEALKKGTERFFSTKTISEAGHYGLGLAIAQEVADNCNGELHLENIYQQQKVVGAQVCLTFWKNK